MDAEGLGLDSADIHDAIEIRKREATRCFTGREPVAQAVKRVEAGRLRVKDILDVSMRSRLDEMPPEFPLARGIAADAPRTKGESAIEAFRAEQIDDDLHGDVPDRWRADVVVLAEEFVEVVAKGESVILDDQAVGRRESRVQSFDAIG